MAFVQRYDLFFQLRILHHYYLDKANQLFDTLSATDKDIVIGRYDISDFIEIQPTSHCINNLAGNHCIFKRIKDRIFVGIHSKEEKVNNAVKIYPRNTIENDLHFTFKLKIKDTSFSNYTNLPFRAYENRQLYFSNRVHNSSKKFPYISQYPPVYEQNKTYSAGDMVINDLNNPAQLFIAGKVTGNAPPHADWVNDPLVSGSMLQYVNENDLIPVYNNILSYDTGQTDINPVATVKNHAEQTLFPKFDVIKGNTVGVQVLLHDFSEAKYKITLRDDSKSYLKEFDFFLLKEEGEKVNGIIDVYVKSDDNSFNLLNADNSLRCPVFELRFKNRRTLWRYSGKKFSAKPASGPHPLTKYGYINASINDDENNAVDDLPNPSVNIVKPEYSDDQKKFYNLYSDIYINS